MKHFAVHGGSLMTGNDLYRNSVMVLALTEILEVAGD